VEREEPVVTHLLIQADSRRIPLADGSVDAIVTDPPYGQTNEDYDSDVACRPEVWRECFRVAKDNAALVSFAGSPTYHRIASAIEAGGWRVRQMWGWIYRDGMITSAWPKEGFDRVRPAFDPICYATKGKVLLNLEREGDPWDKLQGRDSTRESFRHIGLSGRNGQRKNHKAGGHYPTALVADEALSGFEYFVLSRTMGGFGWANEKTGHPSQKPLAVMRWIVSKLRGDVVLDPFCGSASTIVAANALGRRAIGCDLSREYLTMARRRITRPHAPVPRPGRDGAGLPLFEGRVT
jgi:DNA modification methylase